MEPNSSVGRVASSAERPVPHTGLLDSKLEHTDARRPLRTLRSLWALRSGITLWSLRTLWPLWPSRPSWSLWSRRALWPSRPLRPLRPGRALRPGRSGRETAHSSHPKLASSRIH